MWQRRVHFIRSVFPALGSSEVLARNGAFLPLFTVRRLRTWPRRRARSRSLNPWLPNKRSELTTLILLRGTRDRVRRGKVGVASRSLGVKD
ncbi:hypothetical protein V8E55_011840 [Tylopilus felleus]